MRLDFGLTCAPSSSSAEDLQLFIRSLMRGLLAVALQMYLSVRLYARSISRTRLTCSYIVLFYVCGGQNVATLTAAL